MGDAKLYACDENGCEWVGPESEMEADSSVGADDEWWSNWICPGCGYWAQIEDYVLVDNGADG